MDRGGVRETDGGSGAAGEEVQEILGHSTLEMTRRYVNLASRDVAEQHKKFSPMEGLLGKKPEAIPCRTGACA